MSTFIVIISHEDLQGFTHPCLDLVTGQLIELDPVEPAPVQLALFDTDYSSERLRDRACSALEPG